MDPHIIISPPSAPKFNFNKNVIAGVVVGVILLSIPLGVYLVQQKQIFKPQASEESEGPETSFTLSGPFQEVLCVKEPCPDLPVGPVSVGQKFSVQLLVRSDFDAANLFKASLNFPKDLLEVTELVLSEKPTNPVSCKSDSDCLGGYICDGNSSGGGTNIADTATEGVCKLPEGAYCTQDSECTSNSGCDPVVIGDAVTTQCKKKVAGIACSGLSDTSCPANYSCAQNCGPPAIRDDDPAPGFSCAHNSDLSGGQRRNCPICLAEGTKISTPKGEISVQNLKESMSVYSVLKNGQKITSKLLKVSSVQVPLSHQVINLKLKDGRNLQVSPGHPTSDGRTSDQLKAGDSYNGSTVASVQKVSYKEDKTYDLLPDSDTGFYFANGILMGSTLKGSVKGISTAYAQQVCAQVITRACRSVNAPCVGDACPQVIEQECKDFPTPCDVPSGWTVVTPPPRPTVTPPPDGSIGAACYPDKSIAFLGETVTWRVDAEGGTRPYQISWGGNDQALQNIGDSNQDSVSLAFTESGGKQAVVRVRDQANHETTINCPLVTVVSSSEVDLKVPFLNYFIPPDQWIEKTFDNNTGTINLTGGMPDPGFKTNSPGPKALMATIIFKAKASGSANITFGNDSVILSNTTNQNILTVKRDTSIQIIQVQQCQEPPVCKEGESLLFGDPVPGPGGCPVYKCVPGIQGKGDGNKDGKIDLVDLSILLSNYNKNKPELDFNDDGVINGLDYSAMVKYLLDNGVIKSSQS